jgi:hypothetical protein
MASSTDITCDVIDALRDVQVGKACKLTDEVLDGGSLAALVGMAYRPDALVLDFEPEVVQMRRFMVMRAKQCTRVAALITVILALSAAYLMLAYGFRFREWKRYDTENTGTADQVDLLVQKVDQTREANHRLDMRRSPVNVLDAVYRSFVDGVAIEQLDYAADVGRLMLKGSANSRKSSSEFVANLSTNTFFSRVEDRGESVMGQDGRFGFELVCELGDDA